MKSFLKTASRAVAALFAVALVAMGVASPAFADGTIANPRFPEKSYTDLATATAEAQSGDTIKLGEGNYTLYGVSSVGHTKGKDLTFEGLGTDKTAWNIGAEVPNPNYYGTEYNGDYSFDGAGTVTFKNMTLRSGSANYLGFIRADKTVVDSCVINGKTFYWGYSSAEFRNTTFNAPNNDYAIWTYSSPIMTFDGCTFNASGRVINVYTDASAGQHDIIVNVNNCTFNSKAFLGLYKQALNINDSNMGNFKYILNITNSSAKAEHTDTTCSQLFGFGGKSGNNTGRTDVTIDDELVWSNKTMLAHGYTDGQLDNYFVDQKYDWKQEADGWYCTGHAKCGYCGWPIEETVKAAVETTPATCTEAGKTSYTANFTHKCFEPQVNSEESPALNHDWDTPKYSWAKQDGEWLCTAKRTCRRDASHVEKETVKAAVKTTPATCLEEGESVCTAKFDGGAFEAQTRAETLDALGHDWAEPEYSWSQKDGSWYCTAKRACRRDASHVEQQTVKASVETAPATCTGKGESVYTATFQYKCFTAQTRSDELDPLGHDWGEPEYVWAKQDDGWYCTAKRACGRDASHVKEETVKASVETTPANCTEAGKSVYTAAFENEAFKAQKRTVALGVLGHDWGAPEYSWTKQDGEWFCTAKRACGRNASHVEKETVKAAVKTTPAACLEEGESVCTAKFDGDAFEAQTRTETLDALGHDWAEPEYSWAKQDDGWHCTAERACRRDASHVEKEAVKAAYEVTTPATTEKEGEGTHTATFENEAFETQTKTEAIDKLPVKPQKPAMPKDDKPSKTDKPRKSDKTDKQTLPGTGDSTASTIMVMLSMAAICFAASAVVYKVRKQ